MKLEIPVSQSTLTAVGRLDRFSGEWKSQAVPGERLSVIERATVVQSVAASCRLSGIRVSDGDVASTLQQEMHSFRDAPAIHGYAAALRYRLPDAGTLLQIDDLQQLHAVLIGNTDEPHAASPLRSRAHHREVFDQGRATGRIFSSLPPHMVEDKLGELLTWLEFELRAGDNHPVPVVGVFTLGMLAVSPFEMANGRLSRVLLGKLLERAGYAYMPYASVEAGVEELWDRFHEAYGGAHASFWQGEADLGPWLSFTLDVLSRHRERVATKVELERGFLGFPPLQQAIMETVREHGTVDAGLLMRATGANRNTLKDNLRKLVDRGALEKTGQRRGTRYRMAALQPAAKI